MDKPKFNLDAHSILLLCNGEQVDTEAGKLQLTIVEQAETKNPVIDLHKDSWGVLNDGSQRFKDTVVKWLNENKGSKCTGGQNGSFYGCVIHECSIASPSSEDFTHILTLDEFCALAYPKEGVTDEPPVKSLKYEDCFERVKPTFWINEEGCVRKTTSIDENNVPTERQAKQLAATIKLMTIMTDANGGEWIPKKGEHRFLATYSSATEKVMFINYDNTFNSPIYFKDHEIAQRAYEQNKEIFNDYFGIGGENE